MTQPEIAYDVCEIATIQSKTLVSDLLKANKIVKYVKSTQNKVKFTKLNVSSIRLGVYCDASYANLRDGGSQAGYIIFFYDESCVGDVILNK